MRLITVLLALLLLHACAGKQEEQEEKSYVLDAPAWFFEMPQEEGKLFASATGSSEDMQLSIKKARLQAKAVLASKIGSAISEQEKQIASETTTTLSTGYKDEYQSIVENVVSNVLLENFIEEEIDTRQEENLNFRTYILLSYDTSNGMDGFIKDIIIPD
jgi:hypothetical protein|tara:strand:- start:521 stop:1000 length:480 start_codon:yes stop_codon:yes gene_type:complete